MKAVSGVVIYCVSGNAERTLEAATSLSWKIDDNAAYLSLGSKIFELMVRNFRQKSYKQIILCELNVLVLQLNLSPSVYWWISIPIYADRNIILLLLVGKIEVGKSIEAWMGTFCQYCNIKKQKPNWINDYKRSTDFWALRDRTLNRDTRERESCHLSCMHYDMPCCQYNVHEITTPLGPHRWNDTISI